MGLKRFNFCDSTHQSLFQYCCLRQKKVYCAKCWQKSNHYAQCYSTRCGHYSKLNCLTVSRALQIKTMHYYDSLINYNPNQNTENNMNQSNQSNSQNKKQNSDQVLESFISSSKTPINKLSSPQIVSLNSFSSLASLASSSSQLNSNNEGINNTNKKPSFFEQCNRFFSKLNFRITQQIKSFVQQKLPLFVWGMCYYMLQHKYSQLTKKTEEGGRNSHPNQNQSSNNNLNKNQSNQPTLDQKNIQRFDAVCNHLLKISNGKIALSKYECLQAAISSFYQIDHQLQGFKQFKKDSFNFNRKNSQEILQNKNQLNQVFKYFQDNTSKMTSSLKESIKSHFEKETKKMVLQFSPDMKYQSIGFQGKSPSFILKQNSPSQNLLTDLYSKFQNYSTQIYRGFSLNIQTLEKYPEQMLQIGKTFMKQKLFDTYDSISFSKKSQFPYKITYLMSTSLQGNQIYDKTVLNLQRSVIKTYDKSSQKPFFNSASLAIIGKQVIIIRFQNHPQLSYSIKVFGYKKQRQKYYSDVIQILGLKNAPQSKKQQYVQYSIQNNLNSSPASAANNKLQLAYCNLRIAYQMIFLNEKDQYCFQGFEVASSRGAQMMKGLIIGWKKYAKIDLKFGQNMKNYIQLAL